MTLLFILLHLNADATMRLEGFSLLLWPELYPVSQTNNDRYKPQNVSASCSYSSDFVDGYNRYSSYVNILKPSPNGVASTRKPVENLGLTATSFGQGLRALASTCDDLRSHQIFARKSKQVFHRLVTQPKSTQVE